MKKMMVFILYILFISCKADMSLEEKLGQLFCISVPVQSNQRHLDSVKRTIHEHNIGSVIINRTGTYDRLLQTVCTLKSEFPNLLIMIDGEWGLSMRILDAQQYPRNLTLGALEDDSLIYELGCTIGRDLKNAGIDFNCAPVIDTNSNPNNPVIGDRSFSEDPHEVITRARAYINGLSQSGILSSCKHYPNHGDTDVDSHLGLPRIEAPYEELTSRHLLPFYALAKENIPAIMTAHMVVPALTGDTHRPVTFSRQALEHMRDRGYEGLFLTDGLNMHALTKYFELAGETAEPGRIELEALKAGHDILVMAQNIPHAISLIKSAIAQGDITEEEINQHVDRINHVKAKRRLSSLTCPRTDSELATILYQNAITDFGAQGSLRNVGPEQSVAYIQIGGQRNNAFQQVLEKKCPDLKVDYMGAIPAGPDLTEIESFVAADNTVVVGIFDMNKFAKANFGIAQETLEFIKRINTHSNKKVIISLFGSPYSLKFFEDYDHILVAYEDAPEAQIAAAQTITGLPAQGSLPVTASSKFTRTRVLKD